MQPSKKPRGCPKKQPSHLSYTEQGSSEDRQGEICLVNQEERQPLKIIIKPRPAYKRVFESSPVVNAASGVFSDGSTTLVQPSNTFSEEEKVATEALLHMGTTGTQGMPVGKTNCGHDLSTGSCDVGRPMVVAEEVLLREYTPGVEEQLTRDMEEICGKDKDSDSSTDTECKISQHTIIMCEKADQTQLTLKLCFGCQFRKV